MTTWGARSHVRPNKTSTVLHASVSRRCLGRRTPWTGCAKGGAWVEQAVTAEVGLPDPSSFPRHGTGAWGLRAPALPSGGRVPSGGSARLCGARKPLLGPASPNPLTQEPENQIVSQIFSFLKQSLGRNKTYLYRCLTFQGPWDRPRLHPIPLPAPQKRSFLWGLEANEVIRTQGSGTGSSSEDPILKHLHF